MKKCVIVIAHIATLCFFSEELLSAFECLVQVQFVTCDRNGFLVDETQPIINKPKHPKKGKQKEQNGRTNIKEDKRTT